MIARLFYYPILEKINTEWLKSFQIRNKLIMDISIIMPNHLRVIVVIDDFLYEFVLKSDVRGISTKAISVVMGLL